MVEQAMTPEEVGELYDDRGWLYEIFMGDNLHIGWWDDADPETDPKDRLTDVLIDKLSPGSDAHVLDVGCGRGRPTLRLASRTGSSVTGISVSAEQVREANTAALSLGIGSRATFDCVDALQMPYADNTFDAAWAVETLMYLPDKKRALSEIRRVLRPNGTLVISDYVENGPLSAEYRAILTEAFTVSSLPTASAYTSLLLENGFDITESTDATAHLRRSAARINEVVAQKYELVVEKGGKDFAEDFRKMIGGVSDLEQHHLGYAIFVAQNRGK